jgi:hypothetical protein
MLRRFFSLAFGVAMLLATLSVCAGFAFTPTTLDFDAQGMVASEQVEPATPASSNPSEPTGNSAINLDGVLFEAWVPEQEWVVPPNESDISTSIEVGLRVTNNRQDSVRIGKPLGIFPVLTGLDGSLHTVVESRLSTYTIRESDYPEVMPGESFIFPIEIELKWTSAGLEASNGGGDYSGYDPYGSRWFFRNLQPNTRYRLRIWYLGSSPSGIVRREPTDSPRPPHLVSVEKHVVGDTGLETILISGIIGNEVETQPVEICLTSR